jgi:thiamine pyrophosphokinase
MRVVVVAGSSLRGDLDPEVLASAGLLIAVDGGAEPLRAAGVLPAVVVGDMDSVTSATLQALEAQGAEILLLPTAKDETDTEAALRLAVERGADEIIVFGVLGGPRLDHLLGNLFLLAAPWLAEAAVFLVDAEHEVFLVKNDVVFAGETGDLVSLLPLTPEVHNVRTEGLLYPLEGEFLFQSSTRGVSNAMMGREARVTHGDGLLLLIRYRKRGENHV